MSWADLCAQLTQRAIRIGRLEGGRWYIEPRSSLGPELEAAVAEHRDQLVAILGDPMVGDVMRGLGAVIKEIKDLPA